MLQSKIFNQILRITMTNIQYNRAVESWVRSCNSKWSHSHLKCTTSQAQGKKNTVQTGFWSSSGQIQEPKIRQSRKNWEVRTEALVYWLHGWCWLSLFLRADLRSLHGRLHFHRKQNRILTPCPNCGITTVSYQKHPSEVDTEFWQLPLWHAWSEWILRGDTTLLQ